MNLRISFLILKILCISPYLAIATESPNFEYFTKTFCRIDEADKEITGNFPEESFIIIRHGESVFNYLLAKHKEGDPEQIVPEDADLTDKGYLQAQDVSRQVMGLLEERNISVSFIVSSPFQRALKTADLCNKGLDPLNQKDCIYIHDGLKEMYWGKNTGHIFGAEDFSKLDYSDVEDPGVFKERVLKTFKNILLSPSAEKQSGVPLIFTHSEVIRNLAQELGVTLEKVPHAVPLLLFLPPYEGNKQWQLVHPLG